MKNKILEDTILNKGSAGALEVIEKLRSTGKNSRNNFNKLELQNYGSAIRRAESSVKQASKFLDVLMITDKSKSLMVEIFKEFFKSYIKLKHNIPQTKDVVANFFRYYSVLMDYEISTEKVTKIKNKYLKIKEDGLKFILSNQKSIHMTFVSYINLQTVTRMVDLTQKY
jgi:prefoldin subunit 5